MQAIATGLGLPGGFSDRSSFGASQQFIARGKPRPYVPYGMDPLLPEPALPPHKSATKPLCPKELTFQEVQFLEGG